MKNKCLILVVDGEALIMRRSGAYRISHYLREHDWDAEVIDFAAWWPLEKLQQLARQRIDKNFKFIGLSCLFLDKPVEVIDQFCTWIKKEYPYVKIIAGGPNRYRLKSPYLDYNINGFGENAIIELTKYLFGNGPSPKFSLISSSGKNIPANDFYPAFPMSRLKIIYEDRDFIEPHEWLGIEFSRGCMFACAYCNFPVIGVKTDHTRDAEDFREQVVDAYERFGVTNYYVSDETFNDRTEKITKYANVVEKLNFTPFFTGFLRPDLIISRPGDKEELLRMNFLGHFYGVESFNTETGKLIGKGMKEDRLKQGLLDIRKYFETHGSKRFISSLSFIVGLPKDSIESLLRTRQWLIDHWQGQNFSIYPLEIPISEYDNPSKIGNRWKDYGYLDASSDENLQDYMVRRVSIRQDKVLIWKNDIMNIKEAEEISTHINDAKFENGNFYTIDNFSLSKLGLPYSLDERLKTSENDKVPFPTEFINRYIEKKLNL